MALSLITLTLFGAQMQDHIRAALSPLDGLDTEFPTAVGFPTHTLCGLKACAAAHHRNVIGHNKCRIKPYPKLTNQIAVFTVVTR